jgi:hypothetical protein
MASSVPSLASSLKLDMREGNNGSMADNAEEHKTGGGGNSIVGESSLALSSFAGGDGDDVEGVEGGWMYFWCDCVMLRMGRWKWGCVWPLARGLCISWGTIFFIKG